MLLVLLDNATAEYAFIATFFSELPARNDVLTPEPPPSAFSPTQSKTIIDERRPSFGASALGSPPIPRRSSLAQSISNEIPSGGVDSWGSAKEQKAALSNLWKQIMEPTLNYCEVSNTTFWHEPRVLIDHQTLSTSFIDPAPPVITLLIMIRILENTLSEVQLRGCGPLESWLFGLRMRFWPVFQKLMADHITSLQKLAESNTSGYFRRSSTSDATVQAVSMQFHILRVSVP